MQIVLTGGTGYIGSALLDRLVADGHRVTALVRGARAAARVSAAGATAEVGDLYDAAWVASRFERADGVIHTAAAGDGTSEQMDRAVTLAAAEALAGTSRPYVHTGGIWTYGSSSDITEKSPAAPPALTAWRQPVEEFVLTSPGLVATVVQPGIVYGRGAGIPGSVFGVPAGSPVRLVGDGRQHWTTVHVEDIAALYALVVTQGESLGRVIGVSGDNPAVREIASSASRGAGVVSESVEESRARLGAGFADALLLDQQATGERARSLGWKPSAPPLLEDMSEGSYRRPWRG